MIATRSWVWRWSAVIACISTAVGILAVEVAPPAAALPVGLGVNPDMTVVAGSGAYGSTEPGAPMGATQIQMESPTGVAVDSAGDLFVTDQNNCVVWKVSGGVATVVAGVLGTCGTSGAGGVATSAELQTPSGLALDSAGDLFIGTVTGCTVDEVYNGGASFGQAMIAGHLYAVAGNGTCGKSEPSLPASAGSVELNGPRGVGVDSSGNLYVADSQNSAVWEVDQSSGQASVIAGKVGAEGAGPIGPAPSATLGFVTSVTVGASGAVYIADPTNHVVWQVFSGTLSVLAGHIGESGTLGEGGLAASAYLGTVTGVALDAAGDLYLVDSAQCVVREVLPSGYIYTVVGTEGNCVEAGDGGNPGSASLDGPFGAAADAHGNLYIADANGNVVREAFFGRPQVASVSPLSGPADGGNQVTITGSGYLAGVSAVDFGTVPATGVTVVSPTEITATAPPPSGGGSVDLTVTTEGGKSGTTFLDKYTYNPAPGIPTSVALSASPTSITAAQAVTLTATVTGSGSVPGGSVAFYSGTASLGMVPVGQGGVATLTTSSLTTPGAASIDGVYSGYGNYQASTSAAVWVTVTAPPASGSSGGGSSGGSNPVPNPGPGGGSGSSGSSGGTTPTPPAPPATSTGSDSGVSSSSSGTATASVSGITASGSGIGAVTVATYGSDPMSTTPSVPAGDVAAYYDVAANQGNSFASVVVSVCSGPSSSSSLQWFDPAAGTGAGAWEAVSPAPAFSSGPPACVSVTLSSSSSPSLAQLTGTVLVLTAPASGATTGGSSGGGSGGTGTGSGGTTGGSGGTGTGGSGSSGTPLDGKGYWMVAADGGLFTEGDATYLGSTGQLNPSQPPGGPNAAVPGANEPVVAMSVTPDGKGYWMFSTVGGVYTFGDAVYYGSAGQLNPSQPPGGANAVDLAQPIVSGASTPDGKGYWEVASDGGIFTFGDAVYYGSQGGKALVEPVVGMASTPDGKGYWEVASDGGIFTFGDAVYYGSQGGTRLVQPVVGMAMG